MVGTCRCTRLCALLSEDEALNDKNTGFTDKRSSAVLRALKSIFLRSALQACTGYRQEVSV